MKKISLLIITAICLLNAGCKKDTATGVNDISAKKDNADWSTTAANTYTGFKPLTTKDTLFIMGRNIEENLIIGLKQKGAGIYTAAEIKASFYVTVGFDAVVSAYSLANVPGNSVVITAYNETDHLLKGTFNLTFKSTRSGILPDTIKFTGGKISTQLTNQYINPFIPR